MSGINSVTIVGHLGRDPEQKTTGDKTVTKLRVAVDGYNEGVNWFDVAVFGNQAVACANYLRKGREVAISGRLKWREWKANDGHMREAVEIVAENVQFVGPKTDSGVTMESARVLAVQAGLVKDKLRRDPDDDIPF